jgi:two-component SAPR family response regulator
MDLTYNYQHVLIIDDDRRDVLLLKEIIQSLNYADHISTFENSVTAFNFLRKCEANFPDLIFIDLSMPGIGGFRFIERFEREFTHPTKFIIVSASDDPSDIKTSSGYSNIINYFIKPINKMDLSYMD